MFLFKKIDGMVKAPVSGIFKKTTSFIMFVGFIIFAVYLIGNLMVNSAVLYSISKEPKKQQQITTNKNDKEERIRVPQDSFYTYVDGKISKQETEYTYIPCRAGTKIKSEMVPVDEKSVTENGKTIKTIHYTHIPKE